LFTLLFAWFCLKIIPQAFKAIETHLSSTPRGGEYKRLLAVFSNKDIDVSPALGAPGSCVLVGKSNLTAYYGAFASRAFLAPAQGGRRNFSSYARRLLRVIRL
jgi:hypothetical protein